MSIVSLEKFLNEAYQRGESQTPAVSTHSRGTYLELSSRLMAAIGRSVLVGESFIDLSSKLETLRKNLTVAGDSETAQSAKETESLLQAYQARVRQTDHETATEFKRVLDVLNSAFVKLNAHSEKSDDRLKQLETGLNRAARYDDLNSLRSHLGKMLDFVRQESVLDQTVGKAEMEALGSQIHQAHQSGSRFKLRYAGREEAMEQFKAHLQCKAPSERSEGLGLHASLFVFDSLRALRVRHGEETANTVMQEVVRKEIQPLAAEGAIYSWSANSILLVWDHTNPAIAPRELTARLKSPLECRAFVGTRTAVFNLVIRSMVTAVRGPIDDVISSLDRFWKTSA